MSADYKQLEAFGKNLERLNMEQRHQFLEEACKELAARLLAKVIKRTPVGVYSNGVTGGTLRRGWTASKSTNAKAYVDSLAISHIGTTYKIEITNPVEYGSYVEYGHRTANQSGWVKGHFMLTISEQEINQSKEGILQKKLKRYLKEVLEE